MRVPKTQVTNWICQVRPGYGTANKAGWLRPEDFFRPEEGRAIVLEAGIEVDTWMPKSQTLILKNRGFYVVKKSPTLKAITKGSFRGKIHPYTPHPPATYCICLPENVNGREVVFHSPTVDPIDIK